MRKFVDNYDKFCSIAQGAGPGGGGFGGGPPGGSSGGSSSGGGAGPGAGGGSNAGGGGSTAGLMQTEQAQRLIAKYGLGAVSASVQATGQLNEADIIQRSGGGTQQQQGSGGGGGGSALDQQIMQAVSGGSGGSVDGGGGSVQQQATQQPSLLDSLTQQYLGRVPGALQNYGVQGVDELDNLLRQRVQSTAGSVPQGADPTGFFNSLDFDAILRQEQDTRRGALRDQFTGAVNQFADPNFSYNAFGDTFDDSYLDSIVNQQYQPAQQYIGNAQARGLLTNVGSAAANSKLQQQLELAKGRAGEAGAGVLTETRSDLENRAKNLISGGQSQIGGLSFADLYGQNYDVGNFVNPIQQNLTAYQGELESNFPGRLRSAVPTDLFDTSDLLTTGGQAQGAQNDVGALFEAISNRRRNRESNRGLGTQGAF